VSVRLHFADLFEAVAEQFPAVEALVHTGAKGHAGGGRLAFTWEEYDLAAARLAGFLHDHGVGQDSRVALFLHNSPWYLIAQFAVFKQRGVPVNVNYRYLADELAYVVDNADAEVVFYSGSLADRVEAARSRCPGVRAWVQVDDRDRSELLAGSLDWSVIQAAYPAAERIERSEDDHYMLYTGGTTGMPKGVVFRMGDFVQRMFTGYFYRGWPVPAGADDVVPQAIAHTNAGDRRVSLVGCPLMHGTGMWLGAFYPHLMGGTTVTLSGRGFDPDELWTVAAAEQADAITIVGDAFAGPMLAALDRAEAAGTPYDLRSVRIIQSSGVMLSAETQRGLLRHLDVRIVDSMGSTEGGMARRIADRRTPIETATFELLPGTKLITDDGRVVQPGSGDVGRIAASAVVPLGYHKDPEKSARTFVEIDGVRHAMAGDYAALDGDGRLVLLGRGSNCINTAGEKVFPEEVEEALKRHALISDALVVGIPDPGGYGQLIAAVVAADAGRIDAEMVKTHMNAQLAGFKHPRRLVFVSEVQRTASGKADYPWAESLFDNPTAASIERSV
jgi:3-oxocholest-4-en-26-oate---CoA ligase